MSIVNRAATPLEGVLPERGRTPTGSRQEDREREKASRGTNRTKGSSHLGTQSVQFRDITSRSTVRTSASSESNRSHRFVDEDTELNQQAERATRLMLEGDLVEALSAASRAHSMKSSHVPSACSLARVLSRKDKDSIAKAGEILDKTIETAPDDPQALFYSACYLWLQGKGNPDKDLEEASFRLEKAMEIDPSLSFSHPSDPKPALVTAEELRRDVTSQRGKRICKRYVYTSLQRFNTPRQPASDSGLDLSSQSVSLEHAPWTSETAAAAPSRNDCDYLQSESPPQAHLRHGAASLQPSPFDASHQTSQPSPFGSKRRSSPSPAGLPRRLSPALGQTDGSFPPHGVSSYSPYGVFWPYAAFDSSSALRPHSQAEMRPRVDSTPHTAPLAPPRTTAACFGPRHQDGYGPQPNDGYARQPPSADSIPLFRASPSPGPRLGSRSLEPLIRDPPRASSSLARLQHQPEFGPDRSRNSTAPIPSAHSSFGISGQSRELKAKAPFPGAKAPFPARPYSTDPSGSRAVHTFTPGLDPSQFAVMLPTDSVPWSAPNRHGGPLRLSLSRNSNRSVSSSNNDGTRLGTGGTAPDKRLRLVVKFAAPRMDAVRNPRRL